MPSPFISVIVPCYNQSQYLDECLQSVFDQTYQHWECIIVDDGSPDNTEQIAKNWIEKDPRFIYLKKDNGGVSSARNLGISTAQGEWILPLDGDDKIGKSYLEFASKHFHQKMDIIYCKAKYFGTRNDEFLLDEFQVPKMLLENQIFCTAFFKKEDWHNIGGFDESMHEGYEDWDFWISLIASKKGLINTFKIDYFGFFYRIKEISRNTEAMKIGDDSLRKYLYEKHQSLYLENITGFKNILHENKKLKQRNNNLEKIINSKRYRFINKILNIFKL
ncbi:Glycosyltransferase involved in cell wall bisynthesis [Chryseobacterium oranimense]|uniref:Glycosyltransferase involved in cell wall bisynthesis n=1 Tax=Chryseobacterium oranimense TaxID=421058 RepID=A0A1M5P6T5_9FLAO|nr:glycosyltransferase family A protein [Chryseobacterium oranimense]SHG97468.1 Glycosyltransferase involved in cell wall bisynthesis [Chryseobacterium oranimense]